MRTVVSGGSSTSAKSKSSKATARSPGTRMPSSRAAFHAERDQVVAAQKRRGRLGPAQQIRRATSMRRAERVRPPARDGARHRLLAGLGVRLLKACDPLLDRQPAVGGGGEIADALVPEPQKVAAQLAATGPVLGRDRRVPFGERCRAPAAGWWACPGSAGARRAGLRSSCGPERKTTAPSTRRSATGARRHFKDWRRRKSPTWISSPWSRSRRSSPRPARKRSVIGSARNLAEASVTRNASARAREERSPRQAQDDASVWPSSR